MTTRAERIETAAKKLLAFLDAGLSPNWNFFSILAELRAALEEPKS